MFRRVRIDIDLMFNGSAHIPIPFKISRAIARIDNHQRVKIPSRKFIKMARELRTYAPTGSRALVEVAISLDSPARADLAALL